MPSTTIRRSPLFKPAFSSRAVPAWASWVTYGLGSENQNLPAFVVLISQANALNPDQPLSLALVGQWFLSSKYQGVRFRAGGEPVLYLDDPPGISSSPRRRHARQPRAAEQEWLEHTAIRKSNRGIPQYEMAYRMQTSVPELMDLSKEPAPRLRHCTGRTRASPAPMPPIACSRGAWRSATCALSSFTTAAGISTTIFPRDMAAASAKAPISPRRPRCRPEATRPAGRHAGGLGRRIRRHRLLPGQADRRPTMGATIIQNASPCGWRAAA